MLSKLEVRALPAPWSDQVQVQVFATSPDGARWAGQPLEMRRLEPAERVEPLLALEQEEAQHLMDELWRCGLRPTEGSGSAGSLAATERHLADMRQIAFGLLGPKAGA